MVLILLMCLYLNQFTLLDFSFQVGSIACDGTGQVRVEDESVYPEAITGIWEELSAASGDWEENHSIVIVCAGTVFIRHVYCLRLHHKIQHICIIYR